MYYINKILEDICIFFKIDEYTKAKKHPLEDIPAKAKLYFIIFMIIILNLIVSIKFYLMSMIFFIFVLFVFKIRLKRTNKTLLLVNLTFLALIFLPILIKTNNFRMYFTYILKTELILFLIIMLNQTTKWNEILKALEIFKLPKFIIHTLLLTYRYIFYLFNFLFEIVLCFKSRLINKLSIKQEYKYLALKINTLLFKTFYMAKQTNMAMISRGYDVNR